MSVPGPSRDATPALDEPVTLCIDYDGADDLLEDYAENLVHGGTFIATPRPIPSGTPVKLVLSFPGLIHPIVLDGVVRWCRDDETCGVGIELAPGPARNALAELTARIAARDPALTTRVYRLLVAEDNHHVATLIREGLASAARSGFGRPVSFHFEMAPNGKRAIECLRAHAFDAMIVDMYMPEVDGAKVIAVARGELGLASLPIIAVSAGHNAREEALAAGANLFLEKPMRLRQIIDTIRLLFSAPSVLDAPAE